MERGYSLRNRLRYHDTARGQSAKGKLAHRHKRMTVKALPGSSLEVVKTELFFHLLVSLLAKPSWLDGGNKRTSSSTLVSSVAGRPSP